MLSQGFYIKFPDRNRMGPIVLQSPVPCHKQRPIEFLWKPIKLLLKQLFLTSAAAPGSLTCNFISLVVFRHLVFILPDLRTHLCASIICQPNESLHLSEVLDSNLFLDTSCFGGWINQELYFVSFDRFFVISYSCCFFLPRKLCKLGCIASLHQLFG